MSSELNKDLLITLPQRGLMVMPPVGLEGFIENARNGNRVSPLDDKQKAKLWLNLYSGILKKRYPTPEDGVNFMAGVDYERQRYLLDIADVVKTVIVREWYEKVNPNKDIAVILYGSLTRGLVKGSTSSDPSNIDMVVTGQLRQGEIDYLYWLISGIRESAREKILKDCTNLPTDFDPHRAGNAGVCIQNIHKLKISDYSTALEYIRANAKPLHDPAGIWQTVEDEALEHIVNNGFMDKIRRKRQLGSL